MELIEKLSILSDAAKYDASCASSGTRIRDSKNGPGLGSTTGMGICHSYAPDGRCISLLKILLTNFCVYDCAYCVNRHSSNVRRVRFSIEEVVTLTIEFYRRNYIEGLFLSSGIIRNPDYTMEQLVAVAKQLRENHHFRGYIHLKTIPDADERLLEQAGRYADRLSINIELPSESTLKSLAPEKNVISIRKSMGVLSEHIEASQRAAQNRSTTLLPAPTGNKTSSLAPKARNSRKSRVTYAPAGQSTQMIIGADDSDDHRILSTSQRLYQSFSMRRVYYSAFSPIPDASKKLPLAEPPLLREHRLYQADWLMRFYGFGVAELVDPKRQPNLSLDIDPKLQWALNHRDYFPVNINKATREQLLRVPGLGPRNVQRILQSRCFHRLRLADLQRMRVSLDKVRPFIITRDHNPRGLEQESQLLKQKFLRQQQSPQLSLFPV
ncbi:MAG: putative DNA modification/repair radical SAM protein [Ketobacteraceae bacterium]|nr:putative DNA modification/repair radical SAM protein [Ketobacteraceae bacterium]